MSIILGVPVLVLSILVLFTLFLSFRNIGATEMGLVRKRFSFKKLTSGTIAFNGEAGYQADLLKPGLQFKLWPLYAVTRHPWVQIPAGQIGVVISQVGDALPTGAKSADYKPEFGNFQDLKAFVDNHGQKGLQRPVLPPGTVAPIHPLGFIVITRDQVFGLPIDEEIQAKVYQKGGLTPDAFGLQQNQLEVTRIEPKHERDGQIVDMIGIVTTFDGAPIPKGAIANRLGDFDDISKLESEATMADSTLVETILSNKNVLHNNYQDFQKFVDNGGRIGLQHDPLLYGAYTLNPFLVSVEMVPMLVVNQGEVAVVKAYVGLATEDTSGAEFKFGSLVRPGHRGVWRESLRTGKYAINPRCYNVEKVPTAILTLNWAEADSKAHNLDKELKAIDAKSKEGFEFSIDLQVQIHVPDTEAPKVISMVGTMYNLVNEVLQAAVGNHFRDKLQSMAAVQFIQDRAKVQQDAEQHIKAKLADYRVETRGVYIQDVVLPKAIVDVLQAREVATQQQETYKAEERAQTERLTLEQSRGKADQQAALAKSEVGISIAANLAEAVKKSAEGEAFKLEKVGKASAVQVEAQGLAVAVGLKAQRDAVGDEGTTIINVVRALAESSQPFMPQILVAGQGGGLEALAMKFLKNVTDKSIETPKPVVEASAPPVLATVAPPPTA